MAGSITGMFVAKATFFNTLTVADCLIVGVFTGVIGPIGDLSESMLKRTYQVKDSSRIIPGHGGVLDRIDALLFAVAFFYLVGNFVRLCNASPSSAPRVRSA